MLINTISLVILCMLPPYALSMDSKNCSNTTGAIFAGIADNPEMKFYLYTRKNFYEGQQIFSWKQESLNNSNFNVSNPTRILVHGYRNNYFSCFNGFIKDAYLKRSDFNVFVVDWSDWAHDTNYINVASSIFEFLGKFLSDFTIFLNMDGNVSYNNMYLIGHSLGAHMSGAAGKFIKPDKYNTIFALDPAGPYFSNENENTCLGRDDANYVEQISTNMGVLGYLGQLGHAAFFPNFGRIQKYCLIHDFKKACSHSAAYWYFAESLNKKNEFCGQPCLDSIIYALRTCPALECNKKNKDKILMGGEPSKPKNGTYYIQVNFNPPFANCNCEEE